MQTEWIKKAVEGRGPVELANHLALDGFTGGVGQAEEIISLCQEGRFEEAAQAAHLDGWI